MRRGVTDVTDEREGSDLARAAGAGAHALIHSCKSSARAVVTSAHARAFIISMHARALITSSHACTRTCTLPRCTELQVQARMHSFMQVERARSCHERACARVLITSSHARAHHKLACVRAYLQGMHAGCQTIKKPSFTIHRSIFF